MKSILIFTLLIAAVAAGAIPRELVPSFFGDGSGAVDTSPKLDVTTSTLKKSTDVPVDATRSGRKLFADSNKKIYVLDNSKEQYPNGGYKFSYKLSDGSFRVEEGEVRNEGLENQYLHIKGDYGWIAPDNIVRQVHYSSGIEGFESELKENNKITISTEEPTLILENKDEEGPGAPLPADVGLSLLFK